MQTWHMAPPSQSKTFVLLEAICTLIGTYTLRAWEQSSSRSGYAFKCGTFSYIIKYAYACDDFISLQVTAYLHKDYNNVWLVHRQGDIDCERIYCSEISVHKEVMYECMSSSLLFV